MGGGIRRVRHSIRVLLLFSPFLGSASAQTFSSHGVTLLGRVPLSGFPSGPGVRANDCWGYVSPSGREYAIIGLQTGTAFVEVTSPTNPTLVQYIAAPGVNEPWRDMQTLGPYAYVVSDRTGFGLQIINLANIDFGVVTLVSTHQLGGGFFIAHNLAINPVSKYLYLCSSSLSPGITAVNLNNPTNPVVAGTWPPAGLSTRVHDALVVTYPTGPYAGKEIAFCFSENQGLKIVDVTNKAQMFLRSTVLYPGVRYCHQGWLTTDWKHLLINDELDETGSRTTTTYVVNVENLDNPYYVTSFTNGSQAIDHNLMIRDNLVFEANYTSGLRVYDITDLTCAREIAWFDTYPIDNARTFDGAWGVYSGLPSRNILVSDRDFGLFVLRMDCNENGFTDPSDIATGRSLDVNQNGIPDECDGYADCDLNGVSDRCQPDCDGDGIPDACATDCQPNGIPDACEIAEGTVPDCNANSLPDDCDLAYHISSDCNANLIPDDCDVLEIPRYQSGVLTPFGGAPAAPQSFVLPVPPPSDRDVVFRFTAVGDWDLESEYAVVDLNGTVIGDLFQRAYPICNGQPPIQETLVVPRDLFNSLLGGDVVVGLTATISVATQSTCGDGTIEVVVEYARWDILKDCNANFRPDECEQGDIDGDGEVTPFDYPFVSQCTTEPCTQPPCTLPDIGFSCCALVDFDHDHDVDLRDLAEWERALNAP